MAFLFDPDSFYPTLKSAKNWYKIAVLKIQKSLPAIVLVLVCPIHCICYDLETSWRDFMVAVVLRISSSSKRQGFQVPIKIFSSLAKIVCFSDQNSIKDPWTLVSYCYLSLKESYIDCLVIPHIRIWNWFTVPLGDCLEKKNATAIISEQQFGFAISTT